MRDNVIAYLAAAMVMVALDFVWLGLMAEPLYHRALGAVLAPKANIAAAAAFYGIYVAGVVIFAVRPALGAGTWNAAILRGALFGFFAYATYDLTNLATLKVWSLPVSLVDMAWGAILTGTAAGASAAFTLALRR